MFAKKDESGFKSVVEGVRYKTLVHGEKTLMAEFHLDGGSSVPMHKHPHEQTGYLVSGRMKFFLDTGEILEVESGAGWCIAGDVEHGVDVLEDSLVIEVFSPVRQEYLP